MFRFREPYLVLVDGTFCQKAVTQHIDIKERMRSYIESEVTCCTTKCILAELEMLGDQFKHARMVAQKFQLRHCEHKGNPIAATDCIKSLLGDESKGRFFVATQDKSLTTYTQKLPGIPLFYIHKNVLVLEKPSKKTMEMVQQLSLAKIDIEETKPSEKEEKQPFSPLVRKKRKAKGPNPLSCKKKQKKNA